MSQESDPNSQGNKATKDNLLNDSKVESYNDQNAKHVAKFTPNESSSVAKSHSSETSSVDVVSPAFRRYAHLVAAAFALILLLLLLGLSNWYHKLQKKLTNPELDIDQYGLILSLLFGVILAIGFLMALLVFDLLFYFDLTQYLIIDNKHRKPYRNNDRSSHYTQIRSPASLANLISGGSVDKIAPGTGTDDTLLYGIGCKYYSARPKCDKNFLIDKCKDIYAIGDGAGFTRSLSQAAANGLYVADLIAKGK